MANFAKIARPLNELLQSVTGEGEDGVRNKKSSVRKKGESVQTQWTSQCERAFCQLKKSLTKAPVLAYADPELGAEKG